MSPGTITPTDRQRARAPNAPGTLLDQLSAAAHQINRGDAHPSTVWSEIGEIVERAGASGDDTLRVASASLRLWYSESLIDDDDQRDREFARLVAELRPDALDRAELTPGLSSMLHSQLSDGWNLRGNFELAWRHGQRAYRDARRSGHFDAERATLAALGYLTCMAGHVNDGIALALRTASKSIDLADERLIRSGGDVRSERQLGVELAECYEVTRDWARAARVLQIVNSLYGPGDTLTRAHNMWALARCHSRRSQHHAAAELISQAPLPPAAVGIHAEFKHARTMIVYDAALGNTATALDACDRLIGRVHHPSRLAYRKEIADEAARIARDADEPYYCIDVLEAIEHRNNGVLPLLGVYAYRNLGWAYRRIGRRDVARRYQRLAIIGQARFLQHSPDDALRTTRPAALVSARELHRRAKVAHEGEEQSLHRMLRAIVHDLRSPLQSLELAFSMPSTKQNQTSVTRIVESVDKTLDEFLRDIEMEPTVRLGRVMLADLVNDVVATFRHNAAHKSIVIDTDIAPDLACTANVAMLGRILSNLVSNAVKYSPAHGRILVSAGAIGAGIVDVHIEDSGDGIAPTDLDHIFLWGGTGLTAPTAGETQHGIGLYTAKRLATLLGANIQYHPKTATAHSAFTVRLRRAPATQPEVSAPDSPGRP